MDTTKRNGHLLTVFCIEPLYFHINILLAFIKGNLWLLSVGKGNWVPSMCKRYHQSMKLGSSKIVICSSSSFSCQNVHSLITSMNKLRLICNSMTQRSTECQICIVSTCFTYSHLTFRRRFFTTKSCDYAQ